MEVVRVEEDEAGSMEEAGTGGTADIAAVLLKMNGAGVDPAAGEGVEAVEVTADVTEGATWVTKVVPKIM